MIPVLVATGFVHMVMVRGCWKRMVVNDLIYGWKLSTSEVTEF